VEDGAGMAASSYLMLEQADRMFDMGFEQQVRVGV
jgi:superfamily II DNA/RNA helicase